MTDSREFQIFVKPVGAVCNLRCSYCYYLDKKNLFPAGNRFLMKSDLLEKYIIQHFEASTENIINFSWHGGEPLLAGIDFFKEAVAIQKKFKPSGSVVLNGIQTNGTLLNNEWCNFFAEQKFTVGVSIDGPSEFHNKFRKTEKGEDTFDKVLRGFNLLQKHGIIPEVLCVVNSDNVKSPLNVYSFIKSLEPQYVSFLPLVQRDPGSESGVSLKTVPAEEFGVFLSTVFDEWVENDIGRIKIQIFEEAIRPAFNQEHTLCIFKVDCGGVPVLEHNGDFYQCDHYVQAENNLGNISRHPLVHYLDSKKQIDFGKAKSLTLTKYCLRCEVLNMCNGECPRNRFILSPDGEPGLNYLCSAYKYFFNHCHPFVEAISQAWKSQNRQ